MLSMNTQEKHEFAKFYVDNFIIYRRKDLNNHPNHRQIKQQDRINTITKIEHLFNKKDIKLEDLKIFKHKACALPLRKDSLIKTIKLFLLTYYYPIISGYPDRFIKIYGKTSVVEKYGNNILVTPLLNDKISQANTIGEIRQIIFQFSLKYLTNTISLKRYTKEIIKEYTILDLKNIVNDHRLFLHQLFSPLVADKIMLYLVSVKNNHNYYK